jgi:hypothetical protein
MAICIIFIARSCCASVNDHSTTWSPICKNASSQRVGSSDLAACPALGATLTIPNVTVVFGNGKSGGHAFVINVCSHTSDTPAAKSRLVTSGPSMNCSRGYATQFGRPGSWAGCESVYREILQPCVWAHAQDGNIPIASCMFGEQYNDAQQQREQGTLRRYSKLEVALLCTEGLTSGNATAFLDEFDASAPPRVVLTVNSPLVCSCGAPLAPPSASSGAIVADALIGSVVALIVVVLTYSIGHNYFVKGLRGWRVLPWAAHFQRRSLPYDHLGDGSDDDNAAPRDTSLQHPVE